MNKLFLFGSSAAFSVLSQLALGCGGGTTPPADAPVGSSAPLSAAAPSPATTPSAVTPTAASVPSAAPKVPSSAGSTPKPSTPSPETKAAPPPPPKRERIAMYNACSKPMRLYFKRPGADLQTSINTSTHEEQHASDGDIIQLMDETGRNEIDRITITASMKEVQIQSNCRKFEAK